MADRKSGQSQTGFKDTEKSIGPWGPAVSRPGATPDHATSDEHAVRRERESIERQDRERRTR